MQLGALGEDLGALDLSAETPQQKVIALEYLVLATFIPAADPWAGMLLEAAGEAERRGVRTPAMSCSRPSRAISRRSRARMGRARASGSPSGADCVT